MIPRDNRHKRKQILQACWSDIQSMIPNPAICGMNLISNKEPKQDSVEFQIREYKVLIKKVNTIDAKKDQKTLLFFLNNKFRTVMSEVGYCEIGRTGKFFNIKTKREIENLIMYSGFKANFVML